MAISIIVALTKDRAIGANGDMLYHISDDLKRFKALTMGHPIVMGRKTFQSLPKGALPGRRNIVVSRDPNFSAPGAEVFPSLEAALAACTDPFIIGGGQIYAQALNLADTLELTEIDALGGEKADTFFPAINPEEWVDTEVSDWSKDPRNGLRYRFVCLSRR